MAYQVNTSGKRVVFKQPNCGSIESLEIRGFLQKPSSDSFLFWSHELEVLLNSYPRVVVYALVGLELT